MRVCVVCGGRLWAEMGAGAAGTPETPGPSCNPGWFRESASMHSSRRCPSVPRCPVPPRLGSPVAGWLAGSFCSPRSFGALGSWGSVAVGLPPRGGFPVRSSYRQQWLLGAYRSARPPGGPSARGAWSAPGWLGRGRGSDLAREAPSQPAGPALPPLLHPSTKAPTSSSWTSLESSKAQHKVRGGAGGGGGVEPRPPCGRLGTVDGRVGLTAPPRAQCSVPEGLWPQS